MTGLSVTTVSPLRRGAWVCLDGEGPLRVVRTTGKGPWTSELRPVRRRHRALARVRAWLRAPREWWLNTRCLPGRGWCWRPATYDYRCDRHNLRAVEDGEFE